MRFLYRALLFGTAITLLKYLLWSTRLSFWDIGLISISGLMAGIFFILAAIFRSALFDYKEADKNICNIRGKICSMNDMNINAKLLSKGKYKPEKLSKCLIKTLKVIKKYLSGQAQFNDLQDALHNITLESAVLDDVIPANKMSRFQQFQDGLRGYVSYLEYGKSLQFPKVGYIFLYFFIFLLLSLQIFSNSENITLGMVFLFSLSSIFIFFTELIQDLDRPFDRKEAAFMVDLSPLDKGIKTIERSLKK